MAEKQLTFIDPKMSTMCGEWVSLREDRSE